MWLYLNDSMLSVVKSAGSGQDGILLVRSRVRQDILRVFPDVEDLIETTPLRDYPYRVSLSGEQVAEVVAKRIMGINYDNFKASVGNDHRHEVYGRVWSITRALQYMEEYD
jgi:hypothetical protein